MLKNDIFLFVDKVSLQYIFNLVNPRKQTKTKEYLFNIHICYKNNSIITVVVNSTNAEIYHFTFFF